jgi:hypothetical protein
VASARIRVKHQSQGEPGDLDEGEPGDLDEKSQPRSRTVE